MEDRRRVGGGVHALRFDFGMCLGESEGSAGMVVVATSSSPVEAASTSGLRVAMFRSINLACRNCTG